jgi:plastocyanin
MAGVRSAALVVVWILSGGVLLAAVRPPSTLRAQPGAREVHLVRQPGNEDQPLAFSPAELTVTPGTTVRWVNDADVFHTVTFAQSAAVRLPSGVFDATLAMAGETVTFRFDVPGIYAYYCEPHVEFMAGIVRVTAAAPGGGQAASRLPATGTGGPLSVATDAPVGETAAPLAVAALVAVLAAARHLRARWKLRRWRESR